MKLLTKLQKSLDFWFLLITSFVFFLLRLPSFFEPYWYGDEGVYEVLGFGMRQGRLLYQGIWDNKPPLLYLIYALFNGDQALVRIFSFIVGLVAIYVFYHLSKLLFENRKSVFIATGFFSLFLGLPLVEGNIANAENFMVLPAVASMYVVVKTIQNKKYSVFSFFIAGLLLGISFLIKIVALFDFATIAVLLIFVLFAFNAKELQKLITKLIIVTIGFFLPLLATVGFFAYKGMLFTFIQSAFLSNVGYVNYGNQFIIPQGFLILKLLILTVVLFIVFLKRKSLSLTQLLLFTWIPFSLYSAFFSQRPYTHYMLVALASMSLLVGIIFEKKIRLLYVVLFLAITILLVKNFNFYSKTLAYYQNFISLLTNTKSVTEYQSFFDKGVPRDYAVVDFLKMHLKENQKVFLWTNSAQMYYLLQQPPLTRYTVAYHMAANPTTLREVADALSKNLPEFIVILPNAPSAFPFSTKSYTLRLTIQDALIYEKVF